MTENYPTAVEITEAEKSMLPEDRGDMFVTVARLRLQKALKKPKQNADENLTGWRVDPSELEILREMHDTGGTFEDCRDRIEFQLRSDARRLSKVSPDILPKIQAANAEADEAAARAQALYDEKLQIIEGLQTQIVSLGVMSLRAENLKCLTITPAEKSELEQEAIRAFSAASGPGRSAETAGVYEARLKDLLVRQALNEPAAKAVKKLKDEASAFAAEIKSQAADAGVDIQNLIDDMKANLGRWPEMLRYDNTGAFDSLYK